MKEKSQKYTCKMCIKETTDKKDYLEGFCATCRLIKIKALYMKEKVKRLIKFQCHQEIKTFKNKKDGETDSSDFSNNISEDDNTNDDPDFVYSKSLQQKKESVLSNQKKQKCPVPPPKELCTPTAKKGKKQA